MASRTIDIPRGESAPKAQRVPTAVSQTTVEKTPGSPSPANIGFTSLLFFLAAIMIAAGISCTVYVGYRDVVASVSCFGVTFGLARMFFWITLHA